MGEIWGNVRAGLSLKALLSVFVASVIFGIAFGVMLPILLVAAFIPFVGIYVGVVLNFIVLLVAWSYTGNFLGLVSVQNLSRGDIRVMESLKLALGRLKTTIFGNVFVIVVLGIIAVVLAIVGTVLGSLVAGSFVNSLASVVSAANPSGILSIMGGFIVGLFLAYMGLHLIFFSFIGFFNSYAHFLANESVGAVDTIRKAFNHSSRMWPKSFGLVAGTVLAMYVILIPLFVLSTVLTGVSPLLGLPVLFVLVLVLISIVVNIGARIYLDSKQIAGETVEAPKPPSQDSGFPSNARTSRREERIAGSSEKGGSSKPASPTPEPRPREPRKASADERKAAIFDELRNQGPGSSLGSADEETAGKLMRMLEAESKNYTTEELTLVMHEKGYSEKVIAEVLKRLGK